LSEKVFVEQSKYIEDFYTKNIEWTTNSLKELDTQIEALNKMPFNTSIQQHKLGGMRKNLEESLARYESELRDFNVRKNK
jgi:hypothetical protein